MPCGAEAAVAGPTAVALPRREAGDTAEHWLRVAVRRPERGRAVAILAEPPEAVGLRRYVLVSKGPEGFPSRVAGDFQWVACFAASSPGAATAIIVSIENGLWAFASEDAFITYGTLAAGEDASDLRLQPGVGEFACVTFGTRPQVEGEVDSVTFVPECSELPPHVQDGYAQYYTAYSSIDGHELAWEDTKQTPRPPLEFTYGESHFVPIYRLLSCLGACQDDVVVDLGSGTGRLVLAAALAFPRLRCCRGLELLPGLHRAAERALGRISGSAPVVLQQADLLEENWSDGTIVFAMSLCFPDGMLEALERKVLSLAPGARVVTMHCFFGESLGPDALQPVPMRECEPRNAVPSEMSFGETPLYVFERPGPRLALDLSAMD